MLRWHVPSSQLLSCCHFFLLSRWGWKSNCECSLIFGRGRLPFSCFYHLGGTYPLPQWFVQSPRSDQSNLSIYEVSLIRLVHTSNAQVKNNPWLELIAQHGLCSTLWIKSLTSSPWSCFVSIKMLAITFWTREKLLEKMGLKVVPTYLWISNQYANPIIGHVDENAPKDHNPSVSF